jgi:ABC-type sugar transport system, periplasmic component
MKKVFAFFLAACLVFMLAACSLSEDQTDGTEEQNNAASDTQKDVVIDMGTPADNPVTLAAGQYNIGISVYDMTYDISMAQLCSDIRSSFAGLAMTDVSFNVTISDGQSDMEIQMAQIDAFIADEVDLLIVGLLNVTFAGEVTTKAKTAGIPVIYTSRTPDKNDSQAWNYEGKVSYAGGNPFSAGVMQGEIIRDLPDNGDIDGDGAVRYIILGGDEMNQDAFSRAFFPPKVLVAAGIDVECLYLEYCNWDRVQGAAVAASAIAQFGSKIDVIFAGNDDMAIGALEACQNAGLVVGEDIYIVGIDGIGPAVSAVENGELTGTVTRDIASEAQTLVNAATIALGGDPLKKCYKVDYKKITL